MGILDNKADFSPVTQLQNCKIFKDSRPWEIVEPKWLKLEGENLKKLGGGGAAAPPCHSPSATPDLRSHLKRHFYALFMW